jgi:hypothetical protein
MREWQARLGLLVAIQFTLRMKAVLQVEVAKHVGAHFAQWQALAFDRGPAQAQAPKRGQVAPAGARAALQEPGPSQGPSAGAKGSVVQELDRFTLDSSLSCR